MKNIARIITIAKPLRGFFLISVLIIVVGATLELLIPLTSKYAVDYITKLISDPSLSLTPMILLVAIMFILSMTGVFLEAINGRLGDHIAGKLRKLLTEQFYRHVLSLPQEYFDSELSGRILNQLNRGIDTIGQFTNTATNFIVPTLIQTIFTIIFLAYFNIWIALLSFSLFPIYVYLSYLSTKQWGKREIEKNKHEDLIRGRIGEVLTNMKIVKNSTTEYSEFGIVSNNLTTINAIYANQSAWYHFFDFLRNASLVIIITLVTVIIFQQTIAAAFTIGTMVMLLQLMNQLRRPLFAMSYILSQIQRAESGSKEFFEILALPARETFTTSSRTISYEKNPSIRFDNVTFQYGESDTILKGISFTAQSPQTIALVGPSGAGKTTIINLILRLYEPKSGSIYLNNRSFNDLDHSFIRQYTALVFQDNELFSTTIRENIAYGVPKAKSTEIIEALKKANAYSFVEKMPKGIDTEVGERGVKLSGGQKQRIQIARALLANKPILILDEATSNLDSQSEHEVQEALKKVMKGRLVIIIAHRLSTIQHADRIFVIDKGNIAEQGTPSELASKNGIYAKLIQYQLEGNKQLLKQFELL